MPWGPGVAGGGGGQGRGLTRPGGEGAGDDSVASNDINAGVTGNAFNAGRDGTASDAPVAVLAGWCRRAWGSARELA